MEKNMEKNQIKDEPPSNVGQLKEKNVNDNEKSKDIIKREIKTYVLRIGRMTASQEKAYNELSPVWCIPYEEKKLNFIDIFNNTNPIIIEIGFGMGDATIALAEANPDINYIGIEVHRPGVGRVLSEINKRNLKNLFLIQHDALEILDSMIPDDSLAGFHIFFPDPWPKKRHHKRRIMQRPRTDLMAKKLAPGGYLYFVTDWYEYAEFALEELKMTKSLENKYEGFADPQPWRSQTKFERKGKAADRPITEIMFEKK